MVGISAGSLNSSSGGSVALCMYYLAVEVHGKSLFASSLGASCGVGVWVLEAEVMLYESRGPFYQVPTGRRDGRVSNASHAANMPTIQDSVALLRAKFAEKGLSEKDLVLLCAAHTIGTTACFFLEKRLYDFSPAFRSDPRINPVFLPELQFRCPPGGDPNERLPLDRGSVGRFDLQILSNIRSGFAAIESDAALYTEPSTRAIVDAYLGPVHPVLGPFFEKDFVEAIVRMGVVGVRTGNEGEIRTGNEDDQYRPDPGSGCPLLSDFGCNVPESKAHMVNRFLVEWFGGAGIPRAEGLRLCSHAGCGRPETRQHEFRRCCVRGCQLLLPCVPGTSLEALTQVSVCADRLMAP